MKSKAFIKKIQEKSMNIWPSEKYYFLDGWIVRIDKGATYRANSVLPLNYWGENPEEDVERVEEIYSKYNLSSKFQLHDRFSPDSLKSVLTKRKYEIIMPTAVMGSVLAELNEIGIKRTLTVESVNNRREFWSKALSRFSPNRTTEKMKIIDGIMDRIQIPYKNFFYTRDNDKIIGVLLAVVDSQYLCLLNLAVDPYFRRRDVASSLVTKSITWGMKVGAKKIFLQVERNNKAALKFYDKMGLEEWFGYRYYELNLKK
ncbi:MAG: GNAT family N-acetyltransferase [Candidatus Hodarchaeales archaeon]